MHFRSERTIVLVLLMSTFVNVAALHQMDRPTEKVVWHPDFVAEVWDMTDGYNHAPKNGEIDAIRDRMDFISQYVQEDELLNTPRPTFDADGRMEKEETGQGCECLNWADVYEQHGVQCGQVFEMQSRTKVTGEYVLKKDAPFIANTTQPYWGFCKDFFKVFHTNYCLNQRFMSPKVMFEGWNYDKRMTGTWCYTSASCPHVRMKVAGTDVGWKECSADRGDTNLGDLPIEETVKLGYEQKLDQGMLAGWAYVWGIGTPAEAEGNHRFWNSQSKEIGRPLFLWPYDDTKEWYSLENTVPRMVATKDKLWIHELSADESVHEIPRARWNVTCKMGCE